MDKYNRWRKDRKYGRRNPLHFCVYSLPLCEWASLVAWYSHFSAVDEMLLHSKLHVKYSCQRRRTNNVNENRNSKLNNTLARHHPNVSCWSKILKDKTLKFLSNWWQKTLVFRSFVAQDKKNEYVAQDNSIMNSFSVGNNTEKCVESLSYVKNWIHNRNIG